MKILTVAAPSGVDHLHRSLSLFARLVLKHPELEIHVVCDKVYLELLSGVFRIPSSIQNRFVFHHDIFSHSIGWCSDPEQYVDGHLTDWETPLASLIREHDFCAVFSDNLAGVLKIRPDAVMIGNFLWSDVLEASHPASEHVAEFVRIERDLLRKYRPFVLCSGEMILPGVLQRAQPIRCGLMTDYISPAIPKAERKEPADLKIALLSDTECWDSDVLADVALTVAKRTGWSLYLDAEIKEVCSEPHDQLRLFGGMPKDYDELDAVVASPSFSRVNECLVSAVPMVTYHQPKHIHKSYMAARLSQLGLGIDLGSALSVMPIIDAIHVATSAKFRDGFLASRSKINCNGYEEAVLWIEKRLGPALESNLQGTTENKLRWS